MSDINMDSVFDQYNNDEIAFDIMFDQDDTLIDIVKGVNENGEFDSDIDFDVNHQETEVKDTKDIAAELGPNNDVPMGAKDAEGTKDGKEDLADSQEIKNLEKNGDSDFDDLINFDKLEDDYADGKDNGTAPKCNEVTPSLEDEVNEADDMLSELDDDDIELGPNNDVPMGAKDAEGTKDGEDDLADSQEIKELEKNGDSDFDDLINFDKLEDDYADGKDNGTAPKCNEVTPSLEDEVNESYIIQEGKIFNFLFGTPEFRAMKKEKKAFINKVANCIDSVLLDNAIFSHSNKPFLNIGNGDFIKRNGKSFELIITPPDTTSTSTSVGGAIGIGPIIGSSSSVSSNRAETLKFVQQILKGLKEFKSEIIDKIKEKTGTDIDYSVSSRGDTILIIKITVKNWNKDESVNEDADFDNSFLDDEEDMYSSDLDDEDSVATDDYEEITDESFMDIAMGIYEDASDIAAERQEDEEDAIIADASENDEGPASIDLSPDMMDDELIDAVIGN